MSSDSEEDCYGPALPPHLMQKKLEEEKASTIENRSTAVIGPSLPPGFNKSSSVAIPQRNEQVDVQADLCSAAAKRTTAAPRDPFAPERPYGEGLHEEYDGEKYKSFPQDEEVEDDDDDDDDDIIGPYPPDHPKAQARSVRADLSANRVGDGEKLKREEWMLIPPKNKPISNLVSRKFLPRSLETSNEDEGTNEKQDLKEEFQARLIEKRDELMSNLQSESGSAESLLEIHRKNLKKRKLEEAKQDEPSARANPFMDRKPFDRETDLKVFKLDADDKNKFINRANAELKGRFSHGSKAGKYL